MVSLNLKENEVTLNFLIGDKEVDSFWLLLFITEHIVFDLIFGVGILLFIGSYILKGDDDI